MISAVLLESRMMKHAKNHGMVVKENMGSIKSHDTKEIGLTHFLTADNSQQKTLAKQTPPLQLPVSMRHSATTASPTPLDPWHASA
jgi:hypothetical protein